MGKKRFKAEQIIRMLREADVEVAKGQAIAHVCTKLGISEQTYYKWRKEYGGMKVDQAKRLKELEEENSRLKKLVADLTLDKDILKEAPQKTSKPGKAENINKAYSRKVLSCIAASGV